MRWLCLAIVLFGFAYGIDSATALRNVEFYNREERVDIMLAFAAPYDEEITTSNHDTYTTITFPKATIDKPYQQNIGTFGIEAIQVAPLDSDMVVIVLGGHRLRIQSTRLIEGYGLRLRITQKPDDPLGKLKDTLNDLQ